MTTQAEQEYQAALRQHQIALDKFWSVEPVAELIDITIHELNAAELRVKCARDRLRAASKKGVEVVESLRF